MRLSSHEGGGGWPGGVGGLPPSPFGGGISLFGDGIARGGITGAYTYGGGVWTVTGAATVNIISETGAAVLMGRRLVVDGASAVLTVSTNAKGLLLFMSLGIEVKNGGKIHIDKRGKAGNFGNVTALSLVPSDWRGKLRADALAAYVALGEGAAGGTTLVGATVGGAHAGTAATAMQTGGGSSGTAYNAAGVNGGKGGKGGPCCGGAGAGATVGDAAQTLEDAGDYGGPGGMGNGTGSYVGGAIPSGPGDPVGASCNGGVVATGGGGGLLMLFSPSISIASGCIVSADGTAATIGGSGYPGFCPSGAAGGGCVVCVARSGGYSNAGTVRASGGLNTAGAYVTGAAGGAGSVNIFTAA